MTAFFVNIFMLLMFLPIAPVMYFVMRNEAKPKKNIVLGVTLPADLIADQSVTDICKQYIKVLGNFCIFGVLPLASMFAFDTFSLPMTILILWLYAYIAVVYVIYFKFRKKIIALKPHSVPQPQETVKHIDLKSIEMTTRKPLDVWFAIFFAASAVPVVLTLINKIGESIFLALIVLYTVDLLLILLFYYIYRVGRKQKTESVNADTELTVALTNIRRYNYDSFVLITAVMTTLFNLAMYFFYDSLLGVILSSFAYTLVLCGVVLVIELKTQRMQQKLTANLDTSVDDDKYWLGGMVYYNKNDKRTVVNNRIGMGMTFNFAKSVAKIVAAVSALILLAVPFLFGWFIAEEYTPVDLELTQTSVVASHAMTKYTIDFDEIEHIELLQTLPKTERVAGTGLKTVLKGKFLLAGYDECVLSLNPETSAFILIRANGTIYIFSSHDTEKTLQIASVLLQN